MHCEQVDALCCLESEWWPSVNDRPSYCVKEPVIMWTDKRRYVKPVVALAPPIVVRVGSSWDLWVAAPPNMGVPLVDRKFGCSVSFAVVVKTWFHMRICLVTRGSRMVVLIHLWACDY
ncbi:unnamed protein product [Dicrocoelium dendriticum]|nr:unnamed protein product [Dicrocoelium dendriticum]